MKRETSKEKSRRAKNIKLREKINCDANRVLRSEIYRLARNRDILGVLLIVAVIAIITLSIFLYRCW